MSIQVSTRIDETTKKQFDSVCDRIGVSPSNAISMFIKGVINYNGIPFNAVVNPGIPVAPIAGRKKLGGMEGKVHMSDDFNEPLECFEEYRP